MRYLNRRFAALLLGVLVALPIQSADKTDVRILIDISGSMRQNDPQNLRRPALRMLVGLMQKQTLAGVWTFARWTNMLVAHGPVDAAWKKRAISLSEQIKSPGQFTNIEEVLARATKSWDKPDAAVARHLILLTDGMVDVSKKAGESAASRKRILEQLLPRIRKQGVRVHTIALSARADHALMKELAGQTGGWYQQVDSADRLQRVFLKIFEQAAKPDALPLRDNRFTVDASVQEATVLLFRSPGSPPAVLRSPAGREFTGSDVPAGVAWYQDKGYDLITIATPQKGEWSLKADIDPDNRVMIVTDLKLIASELPTHLAVGEQVRMTAHLSNRGKQVSRRAFLDVLDVRADAINKSGRDPLALNDRGEAGDERPGDGTFSLLYSEKRPFDDVEILLNVESATFMREKRYHLSVREPVQVDFDDHGVVQVRRDTAVVRDDLKVEAWQTDGAGQRAPLGLEPAGDALQGTPADPGNSVEIEVSGTSRSGNLLNRRYGPLRREGLPPPAIEETPPALAPAPVADEEQPVWVMPAILFGASNVLLILGGLGFWLYRRRRGADEDDFTVIELDDTDAGKRQGEAA